MVSRPRRDWCHGAQTVRGGERKPQCRSAGTAKLTEQLPRVRDGRGGGGGGKRARGQVRKEKTVVERWREARVKTWTTVRGACINEVHFWIDWV